MTEVQRVQHGAHPEPSERNLENLNLLMGAGGLVLGALIGLVSLDDVTLFAGEGVRSIVDIAAISSAVLVALVFLGVLLAFQRQVLPWRGNVHRFRLWLNVAGLTLMMGSLALFSMQALGRVAAAAFIGLQLDVWSGTAFISLACGMSVYFAASTAGRLNTERLAVLVSVFLVLGALMSMVNAADQEWWRIHFSALGMALDFSGFAFNFTLILTGLVIITLADFLVHDMLGWLEATGQGRWKARFLRVGLGLMGTMLAGIGFIPVTLSHQGHLFVTYMTAAAFIVLALVAPMILRGIPWGFRVVSYASLGFMALMWYLHREVRYLNTTGFEMIAVATVLAWMVLFIRTVIAAGRDLDPRPVEPAVDEPRRIEASDDATHFDEPADTVVDPHDEPTEVLER